MPATVGFFNPSGLSGLLPGWEIQSETPSTSRTRTPGLKGNGDESAATTHDKKKALTIVAKCMATTGNLTLPLPGKVYGGYHCDGFNLKKGVDWPEISVSLHAHDDGATHADGDCRTYTPSLTVAAGFGVERDPCGFALDPDDDLAIGFASWEYSVAVTHQDEVGGTGNWIAGENRDGVETVTVGLTGKSSAGITAPEGWDAMDTGDARSNTAAETETASFEHHLAADVGE